ncbi:methyl-accepting chemotaxis protein [Haliangium sp.]|uniref:methyl-accepting chemotaxis protein n=1 Tax=Haliangium sp. TaxID=2663208 RepID=UPI003D0DCFB7
MINLGLRTKLISTIVLLVVLFAGFFWLYFPAQQEETATRSLRERAEIISDGIQAFSVDLGGMQRNNLERALTRFARGSADAEARGGGHGEISYAVFALPNTGPTAGAPLIGYGGELIPDELALHTRSRERQVVESDEYIHASVPITGVDGEVVGTVSIGLSKQAIQVVRDRGHRIALLVSVIILVVGIAGSWLVGIGIARPILAAAHKLDAVSSDLVAAAREQEASAAQEAAAVAETRRSMETLLDSAQQIADRSSEVLGNAERSTSGSQQIADRIGNLNELAEKVAELLRVIMQVADKADLLALNASLEGTRAGEAGKGFALVAAEMRRLAENVVESVAGIRELMKDMREASQAAVQASQQGTKSSTATTHSAREIALLTQEQRQATEQVMASMDEMGDILSHTLRGIQRTTVSAHQLTELAGRLSRMVNPSATRLLNDDNELSMTMSRGGRSDEISVTMSRGGSDITREGSRL